MDASSTCFLLLFFRATRCARMVRALLQSDTILEDRKRGRKKRKLDKQSARTDYRASGTLPHLGTEKNPSPK
jgi:hypothetical protein